jgi:type I restriction enzyme S subunit
MQTLERTNEAGIANSSARILPPGTVALSRTASVGFVTILGREMATSQDFVNWVCGPELDPAFLSLLFQRSRSYIRSLASGAVHKTVYVPTVKAFWICAPPVAGQRQIARLLREQLAIAASARAAAEARLEAAKALGEAWSVRMFRDLEGEGTPLRKLSQVLLAQGQYGLSSPMTREAVGLPVLRMGNLTPGRIDWTDLRYVSLPEREESKYRLMDGDILFNRTNSAELVGKSAVFQGDREALFASYLIRLRVSPEVADPDFVCAYINSASGRAFVRRNMGRAIGQVNISASTMATMSLPLPSVARQKKVIEKLRDLSADQTATAVDRELAAVQALPAALLHRAFRGEL